MSQPTKPIIDYTFDEVYEMVQRDQNNKDIIELLTKSMTKDLGINENDLFNREKAEDTIMKSAKKYLNFSTGGLINTVEGKELKFRREYINHTVTKSWQRHLTDKKIEMEIADNEIKCSRQNKILQTFQTMKEKHQQNIDNLLDYDIKKSHDEILKLKKTLDVAKEYLSFKEREEYNEPKYTYFY